MSVSLLSVTSLDHEEGQQVLDDITVWQIVVFEADSGEKIDEETITTLSEFYIFLHGGSTESQKTNAA